MYYTNVYTAPVFDSSMGACSWQTSKAAECRAEIEALEGDFHLVGRLAGWANGVGGVCIGVTGLTVVVGLVRLATVYLALAHVAIVLVVLVIRLKGFGVIEQRASSVSVRFRSRTYH